MLPDAYRCALTPKLSSALKTPPRASSSCSLSHRVWSLQLKRQSCCESGISVATFMLWRPVWGRKEPRSAWPGLTPQGPAWWRARWPHGALFQLPGWARTHTRTHTHTCKHKKALPVFPPSQGRSPLSYPGPHTPLFGRHSAPRRGRNESDEKGKLRRMGQVGQGVLYEW